MRFVPGVVGQPSPQPSPFIEGRGKARRLSAEGNVPFFAEAFEGPFIDGGDDRVWCAGSGDEVAQSAKLAVEQLAVEVRGER